MLQITKPEVSLREAFVSREKAVRERRQGIRAQRGLVPDWETYYYLLGAEWTYAQAAAEAGFNHSVLSLSEMVEHDTRWFDNQLSGTDLEAAERGREFALSIIRGLELR